MPAKKEIAGQPEKFVDMCTGAYNIVPQDGGRVRLQHTVYAMGASGKIYRFLRGSWERMGGPATDTERPSRASSYAPATKRELDDEEPF